MKVSYEFNHVFYGRLQQLPLKNSKIEKINIYYTNFYC